VARDFHGACVNLNQLAHIAQVRRDVPSGADEVVAEVRARGRRIVEGLQAQLSARVVPARATVGQKPAPGALLLPSRTHWGA
jgi:hypothetical protein